MLHLGYTSLELPSIRESSYTIGTGSVQEIDPYLIVPRIFLLPVIES